MTETPYLFSAQLVEICYNFESVSDLKGVKKIVKFTETALPRIYNLALLDLLEDGEESDSSVTNNDDLQTVLATAIRIIGSFLTKFPDRIVVFTGSNARRTRPYRIVIGRELPLIQQRFVVFGGIGEKHIEAFRPNTAYDKFFIFLKQ